MGCIQSSVREHAPHSGAVRDWGDSRSRGSPYFTDVLAGKAARNVATLTHLVYVLLNAGDAAPVARYIDSHYSNDYSVDKTQNVKPGIAAFIRGLFSGRCRFFDLDIMSVTENEVTYGLSCVSTVAAVRCIDSMTFTAAGEFAHLTQCARVDIGRQGHPLSPLSPYSAEQKHNVGLLAHYTYGVLNSGDASTVYSWVALNFSSDYQADGFGPTPGYKADVAPWVVGTLFPIRCRHYNLDIFDVGIDSVTYAVSTRCLVSGAVKEARSFARMSFNNEGRFSHCVKVATVPT